MSQEIAVKVFELAQQADKVSPLGWLLSLTVAALRSSGMQKEHIQNLVEHNILIADKAIEVVNKAGK